MQVKRAVGQGSHVVKYDILSALLVLAAQGDTAQGRLALRLSLLITARYDWQRDRFNVGLREIARLWGVTERTTKREMAQLRALGWITVTRVAARGQPMRQGNVRDPPLEWKCWRLLVRPPLANGP